MPASPKRAILFGLMLAGILALTSIGFARDAEAQVYRGPLHFNSSSRVFTMTVTLQPTGPALYRTEFDTGILVANVSGSNVFGFIQTNIPNIRPCFFQGTYDGNIATLLLDPVSCGGGGGTLTLTRIA
jgi:hypothetical protein